MSEHSLRIAGWAVIKALDAGRIVAVPDEEPSAELEALRDVLAEHHTDYRCGKEGHIFAVPWGDETPRTTVVCPLCGATAFIHWPGAAA
jgi:ribosomal protein S27AE